MGIWSETIMGEAGKWRSRMGAGWWRELPTRHLWNQRAEPPAGIYERKAHGQTVGVTTTFRASWLGFHYCLPKLASINLWSSATQVCAGNGTWETLFLPKQVDAAQASMFFLGPSVHTFALFFLSAAFPSPAVSHRLFKWPCILFLGGNAQGGLSQFWAFLWMRKEYFFKPFVFPKSH